MEKVVKLSVCSKDVKIDGFSCSDIINLAKDLLENYSWVKLHWSLQQGHGEWSDEYQTYFYDFCSQRFKDSREFDNLDTMIKCLDDIKNIEGLDPDSLVLKGHYRIEENDLKTLEDMWSLPSYRQEDIMEISSIMDLYEGACGEKQKEVYNKACELFEHAKENY